MKTYMPLFVLDLGLTHDIGFCRYKLWASPNKCVHHAVVPHPLLHLPSKRNSPSGMIATASCNESDLKGLSRVKAASKISKKKSVFLKIWFYCRSGIWSYWRATRCSSELHWPSGRVWKSELIPVKNSQKGQLSSYCLRHKHIGTSWMWPVLTSSTAPWGSSPGRCSSWATRTPTDSSRWVSIGINSINHYKINIRYPCDCTVRVLDFLFDHGSRIWWKCLPSPSPRSQSCARSTRSTLLRGHTASLWPRGGSRSCTGE